MYRLSSAGQQFFNSLQDYSEEKPDSREVATIARNAATNLCRALNDYYNEIKQVEETYVQELEDTVQYVNGILEQMNYLNDRIARELFRFCFNCHVLAVSLINIRIPHLRNTIGV